MPDLSPHDINAGRTFIPDCLRDPNFRNRGVLYGRNNGLWWAVVNPKRFPLYVWEKQSTNGYAGTATSLGAAAFSNGPQMEQFTKSQMISTTAKWAMGGAVVGTVLGATIGFGFGSVFGAKIGSVAGPIVGALVGGGTRYLQITSGWIPYDRVHGQKHGVNDPGKPWQNYFYLGRTGIDLATYRIDAGHPPTMSEVIGGLIPVTRHHLPVSATTGAANYDENYRRLSTRAGIVAWALVPFGVNPSTITVPRSSDGTPADISGRVVLGSEDLSNIDLTFGSGHPLDGVIVCVGHGGATFMSTVGTILANIGASAAVAMDGSNSVMMGAGGEHFLREPPLTKQRIQKYGFYCG